MTKDKIELNKFCKHCRNKPVCKFVNNATLLDLVSMVDETNTDLENTFPFKLKITCDCYELKV